VIQPDVSEDAIVVEHSDKDLESLFYRVESAIIASSHGNLDGVPGAHCKYCPGAAYCPAKRSQTAGFLDLDVKSTDALNEAVYLLDEMKEQIRAIESEMMFNLEAGRPVAGYKLVEKQGREHWVDPDSALATLKRSRLSKDIYLEPDKLRSPTQIKKAIKAAGKDYDVDSMTSSASTGFTFAKVTDKRPAVLRGNSIPKSLAKVLDGD